MIVGCRFPNNCKNKLFTFLAKQSQRHIMPQKRISISFLRKGKQEFYYVTVMVLEHIMLVTLK
jgi:hypothetical protein